MIETETKQKDESKPAEVPEMVDEMEELDTDKLDNVIDSDIEDGSTGVFPLRHSFSL